MHELGTTKLTKLTSYVWLEHDDQAQQSWDCVRRL